MTLSLFLYLRCRHSFTLTWALHWLLRDILLCVLRWFRVYSLCSLSEQCFTLFVITFATWLRLFFHANAFLVRFLNSHLSIFMSALLINERIESIFILFFWREVMSFMAVFVQRFSSILRWPFHFFLSLRLFVSSFFLWFFYFFDFFVSSIFSSILFLILKFSHSLFFVDFAQKWQFRIFCFHSKLYYFLSFFWQIWNTFSTLFRHFYDRFCALLILHFLFLYFTTFSAAPMKLFNFLQLNQTVCLNAFSAHRVHLHETQFIYVYQIVKH